MVFPTYRPGQSAVLEALSPGAALQRLIAANTQLRQPLTAHNVGVSSSSLAGPYSCLWLVYDELSQATRLIRTVWEQLN
ncbi:MAG: hypothetical protein R3F37_10355 [Candidatus Competibacteraceae bacterium]